MQRTPGIGERFRFGLRAQVMALLVACLSLFSLGLSFRVAWIDARLGPGLRPNPSNEVVLFEARFSRMLGALPAHGSVGYLSDTDYEGADPDRMPFQETKDACMIGYVLAPRVVVREPSRSTVVVGNLRRSAATAARLRALGLELERDFGDGVLLLRREGAPP